VRFVRGDFLFKVVIDAAGKIADIGVTP